MVKRIVRHRPAEVKAGGRECPYCGAAGEDLHVAQLPTGRHSCRAYCLRCKKGVSFAPESIGAGVAS